MKFEQYISGSSERLFVNTALGCNSSCSYCYLPSLGLPIGTKHTVKRLAAKIVESIKSGPVFVPGKFGTIISLGCYSECWDAVNQSASKFIIFEFLDSGNPIQFATKRYVAPRDLQTFVPMINWLGQLTVFISCSTVRYWQIYERGTTNPKRRFESFHISHELNIPTYLYIKPVVDRVTILDVELFVAIARKWKINAVVGGLYSLENQTGKLANIGGGNLYCVESVDIGKIQKSLSHVCKTYRTSIEPIEFLRAYTPSNPTMTLGGTEENGLI